MAGSDNLAPPWQKGQSGNPGGKTSAQRKLEIENAERATRIRARLLEAIEASTSPELTSELLTLLRDTENRGLGTPTNKTAFTDAEGNDVPTSIALKIVRT